MRGVEEPGDLSAEAAAREGAAIFAAGASVHAGGDYG